jgi:hypothetical protein
MIQLTFAVTKVAGFNTQARSSSDSRCVAVQFKAAVKLVRALHSGADLGKRLEKVAAAWAAACARLQQRKHLPPDSAASSAVRFFEQSAGEVCVRSTILAGRAAGCVSCS